MTTSFSDALKRGYSVVYALEIEGIPYLFVEKNMLRATSSAAATAANYTIVEGLIIDESSNLGIEIDRETGVARGQAATFTLAFQALSDAGVLDDLFTRPTASETTRLTANVTQVATTISVEDASGFSTFGYMGKEYFTFSGSTATSFTGMTRGTHGNKYIHHSNSPTTYGMVTVKPVVWRGRYVTLWEHLVTPDGRIASKYWIHASDSDSNAREVWKGYIEEAAMPGIAGLEFTCLPLVRKLAEPIGLEIEWEIDRTALESYDTELPDCPTLYLDDTTELTFFWALASDPTTVYSAVLGNMDPVLGGPMVVMNEIAKEIVESTGFTSGLAMHNMGSQYTDQVTAWIVCTGLATHSIMLRNRVHKGAYFLKTGDFSSLTGTVTGSSIISDLRFRDNWALKEVLPWLIVKQLEGKASEDYTMPASGYGFLIAGDVKEVVHWSNGSAITGNNELFKLQIDDRGLSATPMADPWNNTAKLKTITGYMGKLDTGMLTVLKSSGGATHFGTEDTLGIGFGLAIHEDEINESSFTGTMNTLADRYSESVKEGRTSFEELYGGWLALQGRCVIQKRQSDGTVKLEIVDSSVGAFTAKSSIVTITEGDVLLDKIETLSVISSPNEVTVSTSSAINESSPEVLVRDVPRVQVEGAIQWSIEAPGMAVEDALNQATTLIAFSEAYYAVRIPVAPWIDISPGDLAILDIDDHPLLYNYAEGQRGVSNAAARCVGVEKDLVGHVQYCNFLLFGTTFPSVLLCPTATVQSKAGNTVTLAAGETGWFDAGDTVHIYTSGKEASEIATLVIDGISGNVITFTATPAGWVASGTRITYPLFTSASALQDDYMFRRADKRFF